MNEDNNDDDHDNLLSELSREDLLEKCRKLSITCRQLRNLLRKKTESAENKKSNKSLRSLDFSQYNRRHVFMKFAYFGWMHEGYVLQEGFNNTVENVLFHALTETRLCENIKTSNYHRCGRTDIGVSAFSQVISIDVRSKQTKQSAISQQTDKGLIEEINDPLKQKTSDEEIDYGGVLNKVLPWSVRILAWCPVEQQKNARFNCIYRTYHYYFKRNNLDIERMMEAAKLFEGLHNFKNFCKFDRTRKNISYNRRIYRSTIEKVNEETDDYYYRFVISGSSFLWHQIRLMVPVLFFVGEHKEHPSVIEYMLNVKECHSRPEYPMAAETPLVLYECKFDDDVENNWINCEDSSFKLTNHFLNTSMNMQLFNEFFAKIKGFAGERPRYPFKRDHQKLCDRIKTL